MSNTKLSVVISSCDSYEDTWYPFMCQLCTCWPESRNYPIYLSTESKTFTFPNYNILTPLSGGPIYNVWSKRLAELLKYVESDYILFFLDDFLLMERVDNNRFEMMYAYMCSSQRNGYMCLFNDKKVLDPDRYKALKRATDIPELYLCSRKMPFRITTQVGLWKKEFLLSLLRDHESAWLFETRATWRSMFSRMYVYSVDKSVFSYPIGGYIWGGKCLEEYIRVFDKDILSASIKKRGILVDGNSRTYSPTPHNLKYYYHKLLSALPQW